MSCLKKAAMSLLGLVVLTVFNLPLPFIFTQSSHSQTTPGFILWGGLMILCGDIALIQFLLLLKIRFDKHGWFIFINVPVFILMNYATSSVISDILLNPSLRNWIGVYLIALGVFSGLFQLVLFILVARIDAIIDFSWKVANLAICYFMVFFVGTMIFNMIFADMKSYAFSTPLAVWFWISASFFIVFTLLLWVYSLRIYASRFNYYAFKKINQAFGYSYMFIYMPFGTYWFIRGTVLTNNWMMADARSFLAVNKAIFTLSLFGWTALPGVLVALGAMTYFLLLALKPLFKCFRKCCRRRQHYQPDFYEAFPGQEQESGSQPNFDDDLISDFPQNYEYNGNLSVVDLPIPEFQQQQQQPASSSVRKSVVDTTLLEITEDECSICCEPLSNQKPLVLVRDCKHVFHKPCLARWVQREDICPLCRSRIKKSFFEPTEG